MNCLFCNKKVLDNQYYDQQECINCFACYKTVNQIILEWWFYFEYKDNTLICRWELRNNETNINTINPAINRTCNEINITLKNIHNLTPENIVSKMPTILTFQ